MAFNSQISQQIAYPTRRLALVSTTAAGALAVLNGLASFQTISPVGSVFANITSPSLVYTIAIAIVSILVAVTFAAGWRTRAAQPYVARLSLVTGVLLLLHIGLSFFNARLGFGIFTPIAQLSTSLALVAALLAIALSNPDTTDRPVKAAQQRFRRSLVALAVAFYAVMIVGGFVTSTGAIRACAGDFPLCNGSIFPDQLVSLAGLQQVHRFTVLFVAFLIGSLFWQIARSRWQHAGIRMLSLALLVSFICQILSGAAFLFLPGVAIVAVVHQIFGTAAWASLIALACVAWHIPAEIRAVPQPVARPVWRQTIDDYIKLTKPGVISLLLLTTLATMYIAGTPSLWLVFWTMVGGYLSAGGANAINCYIDRDVDVLMGRTARRPIPSNRINPIHALMFGISLGIGSFVLMTVFVNLLSAALSLFALLFYVLVYTSWLKRTSMQNIVIGGAAGAIPPMIGWAAVTNNLSLLSLFLFLIIFYWTPPHFWALALIRRDDYARAGIPMLPVVQGDAETKKQILLYSILMIAITLLPTPLRLLGPIYLVGALVLGGIHMRYVMQLMSESANGSAWKLYRFSLLYLALLFCVMVLDAVVMRAMV